ncbi:MAG: hypothetical protein FJX77_01695, partial [Armatimonadetes bacterium]|nr:hypothetical protein [Armatimonadota bacterium]
YEIRRELGRGAMGVVYEAHDRSRGMDVALKVLAGRGVGTPEARRRQVERFYREARALASLSHPNIVRIFEKGELAGRPYFSMELVRGTTLRDRLRYSGPLSVPELVRLALELCSALEYLHCRDIIHRDVKPENIMLLPDARSKLMDFGVAQILAEDVEQGGFHGSPAYMSPEQVASQPVDGRSDIFSLAVTLYEAATGRRAVEGKSIPEIVHKVVNEYPPPPAGLPFYLQGVLFRAMAKDPNFRYRHAAEMAADVRAGRIPAPLAASSQAFTHMAPAPVPPRGFPPPPQLTPGGAPASLPYSAAPSAPLGAESPPPWVPAIGGLPLPASVPPSEAPTLMPAGSHPFEFDLGGGLPSQSAATVPCSRHAGMRGVAVCAQCRAWVCYACYVEVPNRGVLCRECAFTDA